MKDLKQDIFLLLGGISLGLILGFYIMTTRADLVENIHISIPLITPQKQVIGFLPFWLTDKASSDYSKYITTLTYFSLTLDSDGTILKLTSPGETEPGWNDLNSGKIDPFLDSAKSHNLKTSLLVFNGTPDSIEQMVASPSASANNLVEGVVPILKKYNFSDLNLDIEDVEDASDSSRENFAQFVSSVKTNLNQQSPGTTLTLEVSPDDLVKPHLIDISKLASNLDYVVLMGYDYHYIGSLVTGPVAPLAGAGTISEYDVNTAVAEILKTVPAQKVILGIPLYGYQWDTLGNTPRFATIPGSGAVASNGRVERQEQGCASCSATFESVAAEPYLVNQNSNSDFFTQIFYPDERSTQAKIDLANQNNLSGIALWALGYEGNSILEPLANYK